MQRKIVVIGSGFSSLSAACCLAQAGCAVTILEKNNTPGGRARQFSAQGFHFDMGPSWYWMPDVFEDFFKLFGKTPSDYYELIRLSPSYRVFFEENIQMDLPANTSDLYALFEEYESGSGEKLKKFLADAQFKYEFGMREFVHKPGDSVFEFFDIRILKAAFKLQLLSSLSSEVGKLFKDSRLVRILEFPVLFLGATPENTPALYSLMNYADMILGTWYPKGGMVKIVDAMVALAESLGVQFEYEANVNQIEVKDGKATGARTVDGRFFEADAVVGGADYHHVEQKLLEPRYRMYSEKYWDSRVMAPSSLVFYLGIEGRLKNLKHHNLFFDSDFKQHAFEIYDTPEWPSDPLFYVCMPSATDDSVAPAGCENVFILIPIAPDLSDSETIREQYFNLVLDRLEELTEQTIRDKIRYKRSFGVSSFKEAYNSFKGNAYGLANTLRQTAILKPKMKSSKVHNLFFTGQLTVPGPGVPPALISGQVVAKAVLKTLC